MPRRVLAALLLVAAGQGAAGADRRGSAVVVVAVAADEAVERQLAALIRRALPRLQVRRLDADARRALARTQEPGRLAPEVVARASGAGAFVVAHLDRPRRGAPRLVLGLFDREGRELRPPLVLRLRSRRRLDRGAQRRIASELAAVLQDLEAPPPPEPVPAEPSVAAPVPPAAAPAPRFELSRLEALLSSGTATFAVAGAPVVLPRLSGPIVLDGRSEEAAWRAIPPFELKRHYPRWGAPPSRRTELRLGHDGRHLFVAFRNFDPEPDRILASSLQRDGNIIGDDFDALVIDGFNDDETALCLYSTPAGIRVDEALWDDVRAGDEFGPELDAYWDVAVDRDALGWYSEFRIPLSSLRHQSRGGRVVMGLIAFRQTRATEIMTYPVMLDGYGEHGHMKPSHAQDLVLEGVGTRRLLYVAPYALGGVGHETVVDGVDVRRDVEPVAEVGGDVKYVPTANLTIDVTANTDFAQVEADDQQVSLKRFDLFFPEKRRFFLERARLFTVPLGQLDVLFHSRQIGIIDQQAVRILGGIRGVARLGRWDLGVLDMQTAELRDVAPSENFGVLRVRRQLGDGRSYAGALFTSRVGTDGERNLVAGADDQLHLGADLYVTTNLAASWSTDEGEMDSPTPAAGDASDRLLGRVELERRRSLGFHFRAAATRAGATFSPRVGFLERSDFLRLEEVAGYGWKASESSSFTDHTLALEGLAWFRNADGRLESAQAGPRWSAEGADRGARLAAFFNHEDVLEDFMLSPEVIVPAGRYDFVSGVAEGSWRPERLVLEGRVEGGEFFDGYRVSPFVGVSWSPSRHWAFALAYELNYVDLPSRAQVFRSHLARLRVLWMLTRRLSTTVFVQANTAADVALANLRVRYNVREGHDLYLLYDESVGYTEQADPVVDGRTALVKYVYTFDLAH